jgi:hypothetical protein
MTASGTGPVSLFAAQDVRTGAVIGCWQLRPIRRPIVNLPKTDRCDHICEPELHLAFDNSAARRASAVWPGWHLISACNAETSQSGPIVKLKVEN